MQGGVDALKRKCAHVVTNNGLDPHAIKMVVRQIKISGYTRMILKSDQEPSIMALLETEKRELGEACEIIPEQSPVGEHKSNGQVENAFKTTQAQIRTMRIGSHSRCKRRIRADHSSMPWLIHHAAFVINTCSVGEDGRTAYEIRKRKRFLRPTRDIGECLWHLRPQSVRKVKLDNRWEQGVFAGIWEESGELYVLTDKGAIKV